MNSRISISEATRSVSSPAQIFSYEAADVQTSDTLRADSPRIASAHLVDVIIPAYNAADTLHEAAECLLAQKAQSWRAIVIDDGSTDDTGHVAAEIARNDPRFRVIYQNNAGASAARNIGIAEATAEWLLFLDADDWISPDCLEKMLAASRWRPWAGAIYCGYNRVTPQGELVAQDWHEDVARNPFLSFSRGCPVVMHGVLVRRSHVVDAGGFDPSLKTCEDWDLWQKIARLGVRFHAVPDTLAFYRMRANSLSTQVHRMLADGLVVTARSWGADPRVARPASKYAKGVPPDAADGTRGYFLCWCAGELAASGEDAHAVATALTSIPRIADPAHLLVDAVASGFQLGAATAGLDVYPTWCANKTKLDGFFHGLEVSTGRVGLASVIAQGLEAHMKLSDKLAGSTTQKVVLDLAHLAPVTPAAGVDTLELSLTESHRDGALASMPVWGQVSPRSLVEAASLAMSSRKLAKRAMSARPGKFLLHGAGELFDAAPQLGIAVLRRGGSRKIRLKNIGKNVLRRAFVETFATDDGADESALGAQARRDAILRNYEMPVLAQDVPSSPDAEEAGDPTTSPKEFFDKLFETEDPWNYTNAYETLKYQQTLAILPEGKITRAMEVACAEGHFTAMLAPRVDNLLAVDIAEKALQRAQQRCAAFNHISYKTFDLVKDEFPPRLDLIICSEVLYYLGDRKRLAAVAQRMTDALAPGGMLLTAHAYQLSDDASRTGFDWGDPYGARSILEAFEACDGLTLERKLDTELYGIGLFRKSEAAIKPVVEKGDYANPLDLEIDRYVVWGGAKARRCDLAASTRTENVPVLMYHRVAEDGPSELADYRISPRLFAEQMRFLRQHGFHSVSSQELADHMRRAKPFRGRPILITFDDGYRDFAETAWPLLQRSDFSAEMFVVTDKVGGKADWDESYGEPAPLMGWDEIARLSKQGVRFGSHLCTHRAATALGSNELWEEVVRSQAALASKLGAPVNALAAPFGIYDDRLNYMLSLSNYDIAFTTNDGIASVNGHPHSVPRVEVFGGMSIEDFAAAIGLETDEA